jgi:hypothetical protein
MEAALTNNSKLRLDRAETAKRRLQEAQDRVEAMAEYEAEGRAIREKTARLFERFDLSLSGASLFFFWSGVLSA